MKNYTCTVFVALIIILTGCDEAVPIQEAEKNYSLQDLTWMEGVWQDTANVNQWETWKNTGNLLKGKGMYIKGRDTSFFEDLVIEEYNGDLAYIATVRENEGPVRFISSVLEPGRVVFENQAHDFPKIIAYRLIRKNDPSGKPDLVKAEVMGGDRILSLTFARR